MLAIYTRLSREDEMSNSIINQQREGINFAKDNGFHEYEIYNEGEGISGGAEIKNRPQLFRLLQDIRIKKITSVWFRNQDRLERNSTTFIIFIGECEKFGCKIYFGKNEFDVTDPQSNLLGKITSAVNQYQKDLQSVKTRKSLRDNAKEGKAMGVLPYGYKSENGYLAIDDNESKIVESIYKMSLSGLGTDSIAGKLNEDEVPTRFNKKWAGKTIQGIIKNPLYKGDRHHKEEVFESPIIIESILWQQVNNNLKNNRNNSGKKVEHKYLLKHLLICGKCGRNYYGRKRVNKKDNFYCCSSTRHREIRCGNRAINIDVIENFIWNRFFSDDHLLEIAKDFISNNQLEEEVVKLNTLISELEKNKSILKKRKDNSLKYLLDETISKEEYEEIKTTIDTEYNDISIKLKNAKESKIFYSASELTIENVSTDLESLGQASFDVKRDMIKKYIKSIKVLYKEGFYNIDIDFNPSNLFFNYSNVPDSSIVDDYKNELRESYFIDRNYNVVMRTNFYGYMYLIKEELKQKSKEELDIYINKIVASYIKTKRN